MKLKLFILLLVVINTSVFSQNIKEIKLLTPDLSGGKSLMQSLKDRKTIRDYSTEKLSIQQLSDLLWAAYGINRPDEGKRTAPSAVDWQETDIYVALEEGVYLYDAKNNKLLPIISGDLRGQFGIQGFVKTAPVVLAFVADYSKMGVVTPRDQKDFYSATDCGYISQNVYLFCASANLGTVVLGLINRDSIAKAIKLKDALKGSNIKSVTIAIGPEGDFTPEEAEEASKAGFKIVNLGPLVLKSDTAGLAALSIISYEYAN